MIDNSEFKELNDVVGNLTRVGIVSAVDVKTASAQVIFNDADDMVSNWLPVLQMYAHKNKSYALPDVGEQVLCVFLASGLENGFIVGSFYSDEDTPPVTDKDKFHVAFEDGTTIEYDRKAHKLKAEVVGEVDITCTKLTVDCPESTFTGAVIVDGLLTYKAGLAGSGGGAFSAVIAGKVQVEDLVTENGVSSKNHVHGGVESGNKTSGAAQ